MRFGTRFLLAVSCLLPSLAAGAAELTKVTFLQMHPAVGVGEEVFLYAVPQQLGYFRAEGLEVAIEGVSGGGPAAQGLQSGQAEFATTMPESVLQLREQGGDPIVFYTLKQNTGSIVIVLENSTIRTLADLKGKSIGAAAFGSGGGLAVKDQLLRLGITPDQYSAVTSGVNAAAFTALQTGQLDALTVWDGMRGAMENTGMKIRAIEIPDQNKIAAMSFATTDRFIAAHPEAVAGMCRAIAKGLHFALANRDAAIRLFWAQFPTTKPANLDTATAMKNQRHIMDRWFETSEKGIPPGKETGAINPAAWELTREIYVKSGALKGTKPAEVGYTTKFTDKCNDFDHAAVEAQAMAMAN